MGGALPHFTFRKGMPTLVSSVFTPLLGERTGEKTLGRTVDALATWRRASCGSEALLRPLGSAGS